MESNKAKPPKYGCPVEVSLEVLGGKWRAVILWWLKDGTRRFGELRRQIPGITEKMLAQQLRHLERHGVITRKVHAVVPPKVEYALSDYGRTLGPITEAMCRWGKAHLRRLKGAT